MSIIKHQINYYFFISLTSLFLFGSSTLFSQTYTIDAGGTENTCSGTFYDDGGAGGTYTKGATFTKTFCSSNATCLEFVFNTMALDLTGQDKLYIYDGADTTATLIATYSNGQTGTVRSTTNSGGCLTFRFVAGTNIFPAAAGWDATISCATCLAPPPPSVQDCYGAIPVCQDTFVQDTSFVGLGLRQDLVGSNRGCIPLGEQNSVWYKFTVQTSGNLSFLINPNGSDDYDWAVYNLTNATCNDLLGASSKLVSCNSSGAPIPSPTGISTANGGVNNTEGPSTGSPPSVVNPYNKDLPVVAGETYYLMINNFSGSFDNGYVLNFSASTASIFDNTPPVLQSISPFSCGDTNLILTFSEAIVCSSVENTDFTLTGPGGPYTITDWTSTGCGSTGTGSDTYTITVSPAIQSSGSYSLCLVNSSGSVEDYCGNVAAPACINTAVNCGSSLTVTATGDVICEGDTATISASVTNGVPAYAYVWDNGVPSGAGPHKVAPSVTTTYQVIVTDGNGDKDTATATVVVNSKATGSQVLNECSGFSTTVNGNTYNTTGVYTDTIAGGATNGCDSIVTTDLTIVSAVTDSSTLVECTGFTITINGNTYNSTGIYKDTLVGASAGGCDSIVITNLTVSSFVTGLQTFTECDGFSTTINGNIYTTTGIYKDTLVGASAGGCDSVVTTDLTIVFPPDAGTNGLDTLCTGDPDSDLFTRLGGTPGAGGVWSPVLNSGTGIFDPSIDAAGVYTYTVTNSPCPPVASTVTVTINSSPTAGITVLDDDCGNGEGSIVLTPLTGVVPFTYIWTTGGTDSLLANLTEGTYTVVLTDFTLCSSTYNPVVGDPKINCDFIRIPNVFTPNGDGSNDEFTIEVLGVKELSAVIYNRWGQTVADEFDLKGITENTLTKLDVWDGRTTAGSKASAGTYYYVIEYVTSSEETKTETGFLTLFK